MTEIMQYAILCSTKDTASITMRDRLLQLTKVEKKGEFHNYPKYIASKLNAIIYTTDMHPVWDTKIYKDIPEPTILCLTKHASKSGIPSLTTHAPGNWEIAEYGGENNKVGIWPALLTSNLLKNMQLEKEKSSIKVDVTLEATHHGPTIDKPVCFVEIGSTENEWIRVDFAQVIMQALIITLSNPLTTNKVAVGIGGMHTAPRFTKRVLTGEYAVGHICPHYMLEHLTVEKVLTAMQRCKPKAEVVIVDWKGLRKEKEHVVKILNELKEKEIAIVKLK